MTFLHKLAKRLSMTWRGRATFLAALLLPHLPVKLKVRDVLVSACVAFVAWLPSAISIRVFKSDFPDRRRRACCVLVAERRRLSDQHPANQFRVWGWWIRVAILAVAKVSH